MFIRSLVAPGPAPETGKRSNTRVAPEPACEPACEPSASSQPSKTRVVVEDSRRIFFANLRSDKIVKPEPVTEEGEQHSERDSTSEVFSVKFTLEGLLSFQSTAAGIQKTKPSKEARPLPRKRPNYNGTKRRLLAQVTNREKFLGLYGEVVDGLVFRRV